MTKTIVMSVEGTKHEINTVTPFFAKKRLAVDVLETEQVKFILGVSDSRTFTLENDRKIGLLAVYSSLPIKINTSSSFLVNGVVTNQNATLFSNGIIVLSDENLRSITLENTGTQIVDIELSTAMKEK